ncbi:hypothetical protein RJT34_13620 [Clitoria ternatea]|uniref:Uncharacterized protein n=1 Tax=Clitoria ternatea TaxID=43366 RepID=A0AAN9JSD8_CLITE
MDKNGSLKWFIPLLCWGFDSNENNIHLLSFALTIERTTREEQVRGIQKDRGPRSRWLSSASHLLPPPSLQATRVLFLLSHVLCSNPPVGKDQGVVFHLTSVKWRV